MKRPEPHLQVLKMNQYHHNQPN